MGPVKRSLIDRFWPKVAVGPSGDCWLWLASVDRKGYGKIMIRSSWRQRTITYGSAHRIAWQLTNGPIPSGLSVLHRCDRPRCCNPSHLFLGTQKDNVHDCIAKGRFPSGEASSRALLTAVQVRQIRAAGRPDLPARIWAERFAVHPVTVRLARIGENWKHLS